MSFKKQKPTISLVNKAKVVEDYKNFRVSFEDYDSSQQYGSSFKDWQKAGLLSNALETLHGYCKRPLWAQIDGDKFAIYGDFPSKDKTKFDLPAHVTPDANWARIHITGVAVLVGHVIGDTFYIVFLDKSHKFYLTRRVTGN